MTKQMKTEHDHYVDIHCHCLHAIDDGPMTLSESISLCSALVDDCITNVIATPHQLGRFVDSNESFRIRDQVVLLNERLRSNGINLNVVPGGDVRVDERICQLIEADKVLTLADQGKYILLELPKEIFIDIEPLLVDLSTLGIRAIITHPERHPVLAKQHKVLLKWIECGALLQLTSGSLIGVFGTNVQRVAWHFLSSGWASFVATDAHNLDSRKPCMKTTFMHISIKLGKAIANQVCIENPLRVLEGKDVSFAYSIRSGKSIDEKIPSNV